MTPPTSDMPIEFKSLSREKRAEVFRLAQKGVAHPDPVVAAAAHRWANHERWNTLANRLPGWLLASLGVAATLVCLITGLPPVLIVGSVLVVVCGLLGWMSTSAARGLRAVYPEKAITDA